MNSKNTYKVNINWGLVQDQIAQLLYATKVIKDSEKVLAIRIGLIGKDNIIELEIDTQKEVDHLIL